MIHSANNVFRYLLSASAYLHVQRRGWLFVLGSLLCSGITILLGVLFWQTYPHAFTPYLQWQDALVALLWSISGLSLLGFICVVRFLVALRSGISDGMLIWEGDRLLKLRDLSQENLGSIFWMIHAAFWCVVVVLLGLLPLMFLGLIWQIEQPFWFLIALSGDIILGLAGIILSVVFVSFIVVGVIGTTNLIRKMGSLHRYQLDAQATVRIDDFVLTVINPSIPEGMMDLSLLEEDDQFLLLQMLRERWQEAQQAWNPGLGEEIAKAMAEAERSRVYLTAS